MWRKVRTDVAAEIVSGGTPSRFVPEYWDGSIPWVTPTDISASRGKYLASTAERITSKGLSHSAAKLLPAGTVLLTSRATIGEARIASMQLCTNQGFKSLVAREGFDSEFLYYQVCRQRGDYERYGVGSTFAEINKPDTSRVELLFPETEEKQQAIAGVLSAVDRLIEQTEALIAKQECVRAGLMQDLFVRGVDKSGRLRPPRDEAPDLYHETKLGWLPKGWDAKRIEEIVDPQRPVVYGILMPGPGYPDGVPVVKVKDIRNGRIAVNTLLRTTPAIDAEYARSRLKVGDLLITIRGTVGRLAIVPEELPSANITQDTARLAIRDGRADFFRHYLESPPAVRFLESNTLGNAVQGINLRDVRKMKVPVPLQAEQQEIAVRMDAQLALIDGLKTELSALTAKRSGLMQDLLTGKVPIDVLLNERAAA